MKSVGSDLVFQKEDELRIKSEVRMPKWKATRYRKTVVIFEGEKYQVNKVSKEKDFYIYILSSLSATSCDIPSNVIEYDESYVKNRDRNLKKVEQNARVRLALLILYPLLGFLPYKTKLKLHRKYGFHPGFITRMSLFVEWLLGLGGLTLIAISLLAGGFGSILGGSGEGVFSNLLFSLIIVCTITLFADAAMRYKRLTSGSLKQYGFFEWLFRRLDF